jgi:hypothetical protein
MAQTGISPTSMSAPGFTAVKLEASLSVVSVGPPSVLTQVRVSAWVALTFITEYGLSAVLSLDAPTNASSTTLSQAASEGWAGPSAPPKMAAKKLSPMIRPTILSSRSDIGYSLFIFI